MLAFDLRYCTYGSSSLLLFAHGCAGGDESGNEDEGEDAEDGHGEVDALLEDQSTHLVAVQPSAVLLVPRQPLRPLNRRLIVYFVDHVEDDLVELALISPRPIGDTAAALGTAGRLHMRRVHIIVQTFARGSR